jgi:dephospho-CoA kinase
MLRIGLTGGIGSGKTTVSDYFRSLFNIPTIDADEISQQLLLPNGAAYQQVIKLFGTSCLDESGEIDRKFIRQLIFEAPKLRHSLEQIIHPLVKESIVGQTSILTGRYCLISIPLLIESNMQSITDRILVVQTDKTHQLSRVTQRDQCNKQHVETIMNTQLSSKERLKHADDIIYNNDTIESLIPQIEQLHQKYLDLSN